MTDETISQDTPSHETAAEEASPEARLAAAEAEVARLKDDLLRALAETENVRRRGERAAADARSFAIERFARDLLPIADTLARALEAPDSDAAAIKEGVALTQTTLVETFARHGLRPVGGKGEKFDPNLHQAIAQIPSAEPAGVVAEVMQQGWVLNERTVRAAMVAVSLGGGSAEAPRAEPPADAQNEQPGSNVDVSA